MVGIKITPEPIFGGRISINDPDEVFPLSVEPEFEFLQFSKIIFQSIVGSDGTRITPVPNGGIIIPENDPSGLVAHELFHQSKNPSGSLSDGS